MKRYFPDQTTQASRRYRMYRDGFREYLVIPGVNRRAERHVPIEANGKTYLDELNRLNAEVIRLREQLTRSHEPFYR